MGARLGEGKLAVRRHRERSAGVGTTDALTDVLRQRFYLPAERDEPDLAVALVVIEEKETLSVVAPYRARNGAIEIDGDPLLAAPISVHYVEVRHLIALILIVLA